MINFGAVPASSVLPIFFDSYAGATGASITITGLAVTDIEIYKGTSMTQRSSDAGYTLLDTDGIDLDGITGIHGFSIDLGDNTDAGFYAAGSYYNVVVSAITVDSQTVNFVAATFRIVAAENTAGVPVADTVRISGTTQTARDIGASVLLSSGTGTGQISLTSGIAKVDVDTIKTNPVVNAGTITFPTTATLASTTNITAGTITTVTNLTNAPTAGDLTATMKTSVTTAATAATPVAASVTGAVGSVTGNVGGNVTGTVAGVTPSTAAQVAAILTTQITESYRANGAAPTLSQYMSEVLAHLGETTISGTTKTIKKLDHATTAETFTLDSSTAPAAITRAT